MGAILPLNVGKIDAIRLTRQKRSEQNTAFCSPVIATSGGNLAAYGEDWLRLAKAHIGVASARSDVPLAITRSYQSTFRTFVTAHRRAIIQRREIGTKRRTPRK